MSHERGVKAQNVTTHVPTPQDITTQYFTTDGVTSQGVITKDIKTQDFIAHGTAPQGN